MTGHEAVRQRSGNETRRQAQAVALQLFTEHGYDKTALRDIADVLGINKASLYYHFSSKEAILQSLFEQRSSEAADLVAWLEQQPRTDTLLQEAVLRWVDSFTEDKLNGIRLLRTNPLIARKLGSEESARIGLELTRVSDLLVDLLPTRTPAHVLLVRMAVLSINAAVEAATGSQIPDTDIITAAHLAAQALTTTLQIGQSTGPPPLTTALPSRNRALKASHSPARERS